MTKLKNMGKTFSASGRIDYADAASCLKMLEQVDIFPITRSQLIRETFAALANLGGNPVTNPADGVRLLMERGIIALNNDTRASRGARVVLAEESHSELSHATDKVNRRLQEQDDEPGIGGIPGLPEKK
ncbi:hypothetical protein KAR91_22135 [Candidatus Pacearchaeota archaeon]|nr:hypothetical protein [Candidatus Pacearchaeota archaeon]